MSIGRPLIMANGQARLAEAGDLLVTNERISTLTTAGSGTILAESIAAGILRRTGPGAGFTDTFDSAANILAALSGSPQTGFDPKQGTSWRFTYINGVAQAMTAAAGEGIVLGTNVNVAASAIRTYLLTCLNDTARQVLTANTTNASPTLTGLTSAQCDLITAGMMISGSGITAGTTVSAINRLAGTVTMSGNATATATAVSLVFSPVINISGLFAGTA